MKKFLALLLMALLLIPALAMSETIDPSINPDEILGLIQADYQRKQNNEQVLHPNYQVYMSSKTNNRTLTSIKISCPNKAPVDPGYYEAYYYLSGQLDHVFYVYACGPDNSDRCEISFASDGAIISANYKKQNTKTHTWNTMARAWVDDNTDSIDDSLDCDIFDRDRFPYPPSIGTPGKKGTRPNMDVKSLIEEFGYMVTSLSDITEPNFFKSDEEIIANDSGKVLVKGNYNAKKVYAYYKDNKLIEWYIGPVAFHKNNKEIWVIGTDKYGINTSGNYYWDTGKLKEYTIYTSDRSMVAGYTSKNVLQTYETWDSAGAYWRFKDGIWESSADGAPGNREKKNPTAQVLEKILHAPEPANYDSQCVTSAQANSSSFNSEGVPYIIADMNATPNITATQEEDNLRATTFNIDLKDSQGNDVQPASPVTLTLAYPAGMSQNIVNAGGYDMVVIHNSTDLMSTVAGDVKLTKNGPQVTATSFSPYTVIWGTADELREMFPGGVPERTAAAPNLPQTGDTSNLALYAVLLTLSVGALAVLLAAGKRRASR